MSRFQSLLWVKLKPTKILVKSVTKMKKTQLGRVSSTVRPSTGITEANGVTLFDSLI